MDLGKTIERRNRVATQNELIKRGESLSEKYTEVELKTALKNALAINDNDERLSLQWALKQKTKTSDGYAFTKEQQSNMKQRLTV